MGLFDSSSYNMRTFLFFCIVNFLVLIRLHAGTPLVRNGETVAFLGDSITEQGAESPGGYVRLVGTGLAANGIQIKIIPAGIGGDKSNQMSARLEKDVLSKKPDWMTLSCGVNDVWKGTNGVSLEDYKANITSILDRCQKAGVKVMILTATQISPRLDSPANVQLTAYNDFLRELARDRGLPLADVSSRMASEQAARKAAGNSTPLTVDGVHMNYIGNQMMATGVLQAFGLDDSQLATALQKWRSLPDAVQLKTVLKLSLPEMEDLEALAASRKKSIDAVIAEQLRAASQSETNLSEH